MPPGPEAPPPMKKEDLKDKGEVIQTGMGQRARMIINLPTDAKLFIDDKLTRSTSERRSFSTPQLNQGDTYYYELRVELVRNGEPITQTRKVTLKAGDVIKADFTEMEKLATARASQK